MASLTTVRVPLAPADDRAVSLDVLRGLALLGSSEIGFLLRKGQVAGFSGVGGGETADFERGVPDDFAAQIFCNIADCESHNFNFR